MSKQQQKQRRIDGDIADAIEGLALSKPWWSAAQIHREIERQFEDRCTHTQKTTENIVRDARPRDNLERWSLADSSGIDVPAVLSVLRSVILHTQGNVASLTRPQAQWIGTICRAAPDLPPYATYFLASSYLKRSETDTSTTDLDQLLAFAPWRPKSGEEQMHQVYRNRGWENYEKLVRAGLVKEMPSWRFLKTLCKPPEGEQDNA